MANKWHNRNINLHTAFAYTTKSFGKERRFQYCRGILAEMKNGIFFANYSMAHVLSEIMDRVLFNMLLACSAIVAFNLVALDANKAINLETIMAFYNLILVLGITFVYCKLSQEVTEILLSIGDSFYASVWYEWPVQHQRILGFPIQRSARLFCLKSMGLIECSLDTFSSVRGI